MRQRRRSGMLEYMLRTNIPVALIRMISICATMPVPAAPSEHTFDSVALSPDGDQVASVETDRSFDSPAAFHGTIVVRATANGSVLQHN
jgi:hypothetical protein